MEYIAVLWVLWIAVGGTTLSNGKTLFGDEKCEDFHVILPEAEDACDDIHPIASIAFVTFALCESPSAFSFGWIF